MIIELRFDCYSCNLFVPDGYVHNINDLQCSYFEWVKEQSDCVAVSPGKQLGFSYNEEDFLKYVNSVILENVNEKAYFVDYPKNIRGKKYKIIF